MVGQQSREGRRQGAAGGGVCVVGLVVHVEDESGFSDGHRFFSLSTRSYSSAWNQQNAPPSGGRSQLPQSQRSSSLAAGPKKITTAHPRATDDQQGRP